MMPGDDGSLDARKMFGAGTYNDTIEGAHGTFGPSLTNPIPSICIRSSNEYLARLRFEGAEVQGNRFGSTSSPVTVGSVDIYKLNNAGRDLGAIYICPYHKNTSKLSLPGFTLA